MVLDFGPSALGRHPDDPPDYLVPDLSHAVALGVEQPDVEVLHPDPGGRVQVVRGRALAEHPGDERAGEVVDELAPPAAPLRVVHVGGGAATLARYVAATRPGSEQRVVEVDPVLAALVTERLGTPGFGLVVADGRVELARRPAGSADLVVLDAFTGAAVPAHLTTLEHVDVVRRALAPGGAYAANLADGDGLAYARSLAATLAARFPAVALLTSPEVLRGRRFGNLVLVAGGDDLPVAALARRAAGRAQEPARLLTGDDLAAWVGTAAPRRDATAGGSPVPPTGAFTLSGPVV